MSAKRVRVQVRSVQDLDGEAQVTEIFADGMLLQTPAGVRVTYAHEENGAYLRTTVETIGSGEVRVRHSGDVRSELVFETGAAHETPYETPYGVLPLRICTESVENRWDDGGGELRFAYALTFPGQAPVRTRVHLRIETLEKEEENDV